MRLTPLVMFVCAVACASGGTEATPSPAADPTAAAPSGLDPVILVHGWMGSPRDLLSMKAFLDARGLRSFIAVLPGEDNVQNAASLRDYVNEVQALTRAERVDIVAFSMGGLSARYYLRNLGGQDHVRRYISIDTPQYGDLSACLLPEDLGGQMCPGSAFLTQLNSGNDTPGGVSYTTIVNEEGSTEAGRLHGRAAVVTVSGPHAALLTMSSVQEAVVAALKND